MLSSRAACPSANCPVATSALARERSSSTRTSAGAVLGRSRSASPNHAAALAGTRSAAASPASRKSGDGSRVALARRALDMMRALRRGCTAGGERLGAPLVRAQSPTAGRRLVDRPVESSGCRKRKRRGTSVSRTRSSFNSSSSASSADGLGIAAAAAASSGSNGSPATAPPCSTQPRAVRQKSELLGERGSDRRRHVEIRGREVRTACACAHERAIGRAAADRTGCRRSPRRERLRRRVSNRFTEELAGLAARQRADLDADECPDALRPLERGGDALRRLTGTDSQRDEHGRGRRPAQQRAEQLDGSRVSPVEIVEHQHQRRAST